MFGALAFRRWIFGKEAGSLIVNKHFRDGFQDLKFGEKLSDRCQFFDRLLECQVLSLTAGQCNTVLKLAVPVYGTAIQQDESTGCAPAVDRLTGPVSIGITREDNFLSASGAVANAMTDSAQKVASNATKGLPVLVLGNMAA